jgi:hypothetical protein
LIPALPEIIASVFSLRKSDADPICYFLSERDVEKINGAR